MNQVNFLPADYVDHQSRQHRVLRQMLLVVGVVAGVGVWYAVTNQRLAGQEQVAVTLETMTVASRQQAQEIQTLREQQTRLNRLVRLQRQLSVPLTQTQVLATLGQLMPAPLSLQHLAIVARRPAPEPPDAARGDAPAGPLAAPNALHVMLAGLSPDDGEVANFVGRLTEHVLFSDVKLMFSRPLEVNGLLGREFQIEMDIPLDRDFAPPAPEVAHAR
jgi:Tfp pilus assembly protein PilN